MRIQGKSEKDICTNSIECLKSNYGLKEYVHIYHLCQADQQNNPQSSKLPASKA